MLLGCIGDDFTGSSDLANTLARGGMRVTQYNGMPALPAAADVQAGVVALKSRTIAPADAVAQSLTALAWLRAQGCRQIMFKYCSTFDSTPAGNIGPVLDALCDAVQADRSIVCPAFPATGRSIYMGHLFVGDRLLNESGMQDHPLTPMIDPDLRRWLALQTRRGVGHVPHHTVAAGPVAIREHLGREQTAGRPYVVVDALTDADLVAIGVAIADDVLLSGGSGIALGLPANFRKQGLIAESRPAWRGERGPAVAICGSCSRVSREQIEVHRRAGHPVREMAAEVIVDGSVSPEDVDSWVLDAQKGGRMPLVCSSADPEVVREAQARFGREKVSLAIESFFAAIAQLLRKRGATRLIVAGGETSGAVVSALRIAAFEIGPEIDPGVPALSVPGEHLTLALKSGNFGGPDFFAKAARVLAGATEDGTA
jgi:3-dehydrotetronate 4-kinase